MEPDPPPVSWIAPSPKPAATPPTNGWVAPPPPGGPNRVYLIGLVPLLFFMFLMVAAPQFMSPMFDTTVPSGGISLGIPILIVAGILMLIGMVIMRAVPTCLGIGVGFVAFTIPSLFLIIMGPAFCLIAQNLE